MASKLDTNLLNDTLNVVQLARQAALARGHQDRVSKLSTIADSLHQVASGAYPDQVIESKSGEDSSKIAVASSGLPREEKFKTLLTTVQQGQKKTRVEEPEMPNTFSSGKSPGERNHIIAAMASGGMSELDIARQFGITRDEIRTILSLMGSKK